VTSPKRSRFPEWSPMKHERRTRGKGRIIQHQDVTYLPHTATWTPMAEMTPCPTTGRGHCPYCGSCGQQSALKCLACGGEIQRATA
jgi:hypothetical protein